MAAERIRQTSLDREAQALNATSQDRYQDFDAQREEKASKLGEMFTEQKIEGDTANAGAVADMNTAPTSSNIVNLDEARQRGKARAFADKQGMALGQLRSFGDLLGDTSRFQARDASQIGQIGGFKRGSSNVLPLELEAANQKGAGLKMFGDLLSLGGSFALNKGLGGGSMVGAAPSVDPWAGLRSTGGGFLNPGSTGGLLNIYSRRPRV